jgi:hypothetical protein
MSIIVYITCKSHVNVNDLHLHIQTFCTYICNVVMYNIFTLTHAHVNVLGRVTVYIIYP